MSSLVAGCWLISAYSPLLLLLAVKEFALQQLVAGVTLVSLAIMTAVISRVALLDRFTPSAASVTIERVESAEPALATYMASFVLPFVTITGANAVDILVITGFLLILALLLVNSRVLLPNPVLTLLGYRWKLARLKGGDQRTVLVGPNYPFPEHVQPSVAIGSSATTEAPRTEMCQLVEGLWLAKLAKKGT